MLVKAHRAPISIASAHAWASKPIKLRRPEQSTLVNGRLEMGFARPRGYIRRVLLGLEIIQQRNNPPQNPSSAYRQPTPETTKRNNVLRFIPT